MIIILTLLLIVIFKFDFGYSNSIFLAFYYHHNFLFYIWAFAFLAVWFYVWYFIDYKYGNLKIFKFLQFSGQNLTKIYVIQWLLIGNIGTEIYKTKNLTECIIWYFIILILTGLLTYTFNVSSKYLKHIKNKRLVFGTSKKWKKLIIYDELNRKKDNHTLIKSESLFWHIFFDKFSKQKADSLFRVSPFFEFKFY